MVNKNYNESEFIELMNILKINYNNIYNYLTLEQELKTGVNENSVLSVFHPDAVDLFSVTSSLDKVRMPFLTLFSQGVEGVAV